MRSIVTLTFTITLPLINCTPTGPTKDLAAIQIIRQVGPTTSTIQEIDGWPIPPKKKIVVLPPGNHDIAFEYKKSIQTGKHGDQRMTDVTSLNPIKATGNFVAGKTYCIDTKKLLFNKVDISGTPLVDITGVGAIYEASGVAGIRLVED